MTTRLLFDSDRHEYRVGRRKFVSVTQVIHGAGLGVDYSMIPADVLEAACARGVAVHAACEYYDQGNLDWSSLDPRIAPRVEAYARFCLEMRFEPVATERRLCDLVLGYAGTPDVWGWIGERRAEIDRKATAVLAIPQVSLQMAGYAPLIEGDWPDWRNGHRYGLQLRKDGTYRLREANTPGADETFRAALAVVQGCATDYDRETVERWRGRYGIKQLSEDA